MHDKATSARLGGGAGGAKGGGVGGGGRGAGGEGAGGAGGKGLVLISEFRSKHAINDDDLPARYTLACMSSGKSARGLVLKSGPRTFGGQYSLVLN